MSGHEYALLGGWNRALIGRWLALGAALAASATVVAIPAAVSLASALGVPARLPPIILWPLGAGAWYALMYWIFDRYAWRLPHVAQVLRVPDLSGRWECRAVSLLPDKTVAREWRGTITIWQTWDRLKIGLRTEQSSSYSVTAALTYDPTDGYRLLYHYRNEPKASQQDLLPHRGFAELLFADDLRAASGEYFNGIGRFSFGTLELKRMT